MLLQPADNQPFPISEQANLERARDRVAAYEADALRFKQAADASKDAIEQQKKESAALSASLTELFSKKDELVKVEQVLLAKIETSEKVLAKLDADVAATKEALANEVKELEDCHSEVQVFKNKFAAETTAIAVEWANVNEEKAVMADKKAKLSQILSIL